MVMPALVAELCPQCGADVRASGTRCNSCGFYLPAAPAPRTGPPMARPVLPKDDSKRTTVAVLAVGGVIILGLVAAGAAIALRDPNSGVAAKPTAALTPAALPSAEPGPMEVSSLFAEAKRQASAWHQDAVLVSVGVSRVDARGVAPDASEEFAYARPSGQRFTGGAETGSERLLLRSSGGGLSKSEQRSARARVAPEPNCMFEDAWGAARRAGADADGKLSLRYGWSEKHTRPVWEVLSPDGQTLKRLDGVSCSILTR
jgi:hypothetical protein